MGYTYEFSKFSKFIPFFAKIGIFRGYEKWSLAVRSKSNKMSKLDPFSVNTNYGWHVKLTVETFDVPCLGNNGLTIIDTSNARRIQSVKFCGSTPPPGFVSTEVSFDIILTIGKRVRFIEL